MRTIEPDTDAVPAVEPGPQPAPWTDAQASGAAAGGEPATRQTGAGRRGTSIRLRLYGLVAIPLLTVLGLYAFVLYSTVGDAINLGRSPSLINVTSVPTARFIDTYLAAERRASLVYLAAPTPANRAALQAAQAATERSTPALRTELTSPASVDAATASERAVIRRMVADLGNLGSVRASLGSRTLTPAQAFAAYNTLVTDEFHLFMQEVRSLTNATSATQSLSIVETTEAHQFLLQEDSLISASLAAHRVTPAVRVQVAQLAGARQAAYTEGIAGLDRPNLAAFMGPFTRYAPGATMSTLTSLENAFAANTRARPPFTAAQWDPVAAAASKAYFYGGVNSIEAQGRHDRRITVDAWLRVALAGGLGLLGLIASIIVASLIGRRIVRRLGLLRESALRLAHEQLPDIVARLRRGEDVPATAAPPAAQRGNDEIGQVSRAFDAARHTAINAAVDEARLRRGLGDLFHNIARRSQSLLHRQLTVLDGMERRTTDPEVLDDLFRLDHMATRMRRHAEGLIVLSGGAPARGWVHPVRLVDVLRGAVAEVEDYARVSVICGSQAALVGPAVGDVIHLLAELIENAATMSPPYTPVRVTGDLVGNGFAVEIEDRGLGMSQERLEEFNAELAEPPEFNLTDSEQLGLFVVGQLAKRHAIRVTLRPSPFGGTTAIVLIPRELIVVDEGYVEGLPAGLAAISAARSGSSGQAAVSPAGTGDSAGQAAIPPAPPARPTPPVADPTPPVAAVPVATPNGTSADSHESYKGLPRRVRQANLAPGLRGEPPPAGTGSPPAGSAPAFVSSPTLHDSPPLHGSPTFPASAPPWPDAPAPSADHSHSENGGLPAGGRSPEDIRATMSAMQRGWERGREPAESSEENR